MRIILNIFLFLIIFIFGCHPEPANNIKLSSLFGEGMVFQRDKEICIWGKADPKRIVEVRLNSQNAIAKSNESGYWNVALPPMAAGGPYQLDIIGIDTLTIKKVYMGEVWLFAGNFDPKNILLFDSSLATNKVNSHIHLIKVEKALSFEKQSDFLTSGWFTPADSLYGWATAYHFAKRLYDSLQIPIGLIQSDIVSTRIEAWMDIDSLIKNNYYKEIITLMNNSPSKEEGILTQEVLNGLYEKKVILWQSRIDSILHTEFGTDTQFIKTTDTEQLNTMKLPMNWEMAGLTDYDGLVWFFREIKLPESWKGKDVTLKLGPIDDVDVTYINNHWVGSTKQYNEKRIYPIPGFLTKGQFKIAIKVLDAGGGGGFLGKPRDMMIVHEKDSLSIAGNWNYAADFNYHTIPDRPFITHSQKVPGSVYNAMIHPLVPFGIKGVLNYQVQINCHNSDLYYSLLKTLVNSWRNAWQSELPFIFVQMPTRLYNYSTGISNAQYQMSTFPGVDIIYVHDIQEKVFAKTGIRAANLVLNKFYNKPVPYSGPRFKEFSVIGDKIEVIFETFGKSLISLNDNKLRGFEIAAFNEPYVEAQGIINGNRVILWNDTLKHPVAVRYNWGMKMKANLYSSDSLPAFIFKTDHWVQKNTIDEELENLKELFR